MLKVIIQNKLLTISFGLLYLFNLPRETKTEASLSSSDISGKSIGVKSVKLTFPFYPIYKSLLKLFQPVKRLAKPIKNPPPNDVPPTLEAFNQLFSLFSTKSRETPDPIFTIRIGLFYIE